jgi:hypothetical protein
MILTEDIEEFRKSRWRKRCVYCDTVSDEIDGVELEKLMESNSKWWCPVCKKERYTSARRIWDY